MKYYFLMLCSVILAACQSSPKKESVYGLKGEIKLITLAPGHFHAALIQKSSSDRINDSVYVYAPEGKELNAHLALINSYNSRPDNPTRWEEIVYTGQDFLEKMVTEKKGNVVIIAGNNKLKTDYILASVEAGLNVLSDKPMAINSNSFHKLSRAYSIAEEKGVLLYDIMTERYVDYNIVNRALMQDLELFGRLQKGTPDRPAVELNSIHHFYKEVSGAPLIRPYWYYDVEQQGEGIVDVTTHLIDLVHWKCFPDKPIDWKEIRMMAASHWPTRITKEEFTKSTTLEDFPVELSVGDDSVLDVYVNGSIHYVVNDVNVGITVTWNFQAPENAGDIHSSVIKGTKATLLVLQGEEQNYVQKLYVKKEEGVSEKDFDKNLAKAVARLKPTYTVEVKESYDNMKELVIHSETSTNHEDHFTFVANKFFDYLRHRNMPEWENTNTLAKYYITATALEIAGKKD